MAAHGLLAWDELDESAWATVLSTSGPHLQGLVVKRTVAEPSPDLLPVPQGTHMVVVQNSAPAILRWREGRRIRNSLIPPGYVIVNPAGYVRERALDKRSEVVRGG